MPKRRSARAGPAGRPGAELLATVFGFSFAENLAEMECGDDAASGAAPRATSRAFVSSAATQTGPRNVHPQRVRLESVTTLTAFGRGAPLPRRWLRVRAEIMAVHNTTSGLDCFTYRPKRVRELLGKIARTRFSARAIFGLSVLANIIPRVPAHG